MPAALRVLDQTDHGGTNMGPGVPTVLIGGKPASVSTDNHVCVIPANTGHLVSSIFPMGSSTVLIGGMPALRISDPCLCGAKGAVGDPTVSIG